MRTWRLSGAVAGKFNDKMQLTGVVLYVSGLMDIQVMQRGAEDALGAASYADGPDPGSLPVNDFSPRVRVQGTITYYRPGIAAVLQDGKKSLWVVTHSRVPLTIGDKAYATGFPDAHDRVLTLDDGEITDEHVAA